MNQFLYRLRPTRTGMVTGRPTERESDAIQEHGAYLRRLTDEGTVLLAGRTQRKDRDTFGIVLLVASDEASAQRVMEEDPAVRRGVMTVELYPFQVAFHGRFDPI